MWNPNIHYVYQTTNHLVLVVSEEKMVKVSAIQNHGGFFLCGSCKGSHKNITAKEYFS